MDEENGVFDPSASSYETWPMGHAFSPPGPRRVQVAVAVSTKHCRRYPAKKWVRSDGEPGEDISAAGLFAEKDISEGTVVFLEQPIASVDALRETVKGTSKEGGGGTLGNTWTMADRLASSVLRAGIGGKEIWHYMWQHGKDDNGVPAALCIGVGGAPRLCAEFSGLNPSTAAVLLNVIHDTAFRMRTPLLRMMHGLALYMLGACLNHSCDPNCHAFVRDHESKLLVVRSLRCIKEGEELTVAYDPSVCRFSKPDERRAYLLHVYGFECVCDRCRDNPSVDRTMTERRDASIAAFGRESFAKIRKASAMSVQGGPGLSAIIVGELDALWSGPLGNGSPGAMARLAPSLVFEFCWAYLSALFMVPSEHFSESCERNAHSLGLAETLRLMSDSVRRMEEMGFVRAAWTFSEPLRALGEMVEKGALWVKEGGRKHLHFSEERTTRISDGYRAVEEAVKKLYNTRRALASDALISEVVMETGRRATCIAEDREWLQGAMEKIAEEHDGVAA